MAEPNGGPAAPGEHAEQANEAGAPAAPEKSAVVPAKQLSTEAGGPGELKALAAAETGPRILDKSIFDPLKDPTDGQLGPFMEEYARLQDNLRNSHATEKKFVEKCRELARGVQASEEIIKQTTDQTAVSKIELEALKSAVEKSDTRKGLLAKKLEDKKASSDALSEEIKALRQRLEELPETLLEEQEKLVGHLDVKVEESTTKRDKDRTRLNKKRMENITLLEQMQDLAATRAQEEAEIAKVEAKHASYEQQAQDETGRKEEFESKAEEFKEMMAEHANLIGIKNQHLHKARQELKNAQKQLDDAESLVLENSKELDTLEQKADTLQDELGVQQEDNVILRQALQSEKIESKRLAENLKISRRDSTRKLKSLEVLQKMYNTLDSETNKKQGVLDSWKTKLKNLEAKMMSVSSQVASNRKKMETYAREKEVIQNHHATKIQGVRDTQTAMFVAENTRKALSNEHAASVQINKDLEKLIRQHKQDHKNCTEELGVMEVRKVKALAKVTERELEVAKLKKHIFENEGTLKQQNNLLDAVRADRNLYNKTLIEQKEEIEEYRRKFMNLSHQIKQIKLELHEKDQSFITEHFNTSQVDKDVLIIRGKIEGINKRRAESEKVIGSQKKQNAGLSKVISSADEEIKMQTKHLKAVVNEQRVLSQQLVEKNDELSKLYETLRLLNSMFRKGELAFKDKVATRKELESSMSDMFERLEELKTDKEQFGSLRMMIREMENELFSEKMKVRALTDELQKPINVHRWRRLKDTDPGTYQMIQKVNALNRQIIAKADHIDQKDALIQQREKLYVDLRRILARQPGNEAREQLRLYDQSIREKREKYKHLLNELKHYKEKVHEYKHAVGVLSQDLQLQKMDFFTMMKRQRRQHLRAQHQLLESGPPLMDMGIPPPPVTNDPNHRGSVVMSPPPPPAPESPPLPPVPAGRDAPVKNYDEEKTPSPPPKTGEAV